MTHPNPFHACEPALADRPPAGAAWMHEVKWDGYRVIARKDGDRVRLWARTTSDYSGAFTRIREAVAALPVDSAVLDGEAVLLRRDNSSDFDRLRSREVRQRRSWLPMISWSWTGKTCGLRLSRSAGSALVSCSRGATRRCATASSSATRSPATAAPSSAMPAGWGEGSSLSGSARDT